MFLKTQQEQFNLWACSLLQAERRLATRESLVFTVKPQTCGSFPQIQVVKSALLTLHRAVGLFLLLHPFRDG